MVAELVVCQLEQVLAQLLEAVSAIVAAAHRPGGMRRKPSRHKRQMRRLILIGGGVQAGERLRWPELGGVEFSIQGRVEKRGRNGRKARTQWWKWPRWKPRR